MVRWFTEKVRESTSKLERFCFDDICADIRVKSKKRKEKVRNSIRYLKRTGEVISVEPGFYQYQTPQKPISQIEKMWRAITIKEYFTRRDIVRLTGVSRRYVNQYVGYLEQNGFISVELGNGFPKGTYRLNDPDSAPIGHPVIPGGWRRNASP